MDFRTITTMGRRGDSVTYGISLDRRQLEFDGIVERIEDGERVEAIVRRQGPGEWNVKVPDMAEESEPKPEAATTVPRRPGGRD